ncbi:hypothetical protein PAXRUDRAFT_163731 [Paxillus rubicundulus Ve08.2h10]|uniref:Zn(2)-C6 fungal-type domain-containing protein n=1 Tax=Paxillus rubicundulus Ve08.2h10 TaxID=930991 RepID=A0A0D0D4K1_9AGAM|nr:hypothetical protein PAXRUDRAFT_163731 [Paxillus rubicundulus Ve08.2h10]
MTPSPLTTLLTKSVPPTLKKPAEQVAFEAATARLHALMLTILGDANNLVEEWDMWSDKWNVAMGAMGEANTGAIAKGLILQLEAAIIPSIQEADDALRRIVIDAIGQREAANHLEVEAQAWAGSPMAEDPAPTEPAHHTPAASKSSWAMTRSKMEVALPRGKGKKCLHQDLGGEEVAAFPPQGMVIHQDPCIKCVGSTVPCHGLPGHTCKKCAGLKVKCVHSQGRVAGDQTGTVPRPVRAAAPVAGPSMRPREEAVIVVQAGKGKAVSTQAKGVMVNEGDFEEIMWRLLVCKSKVRDTQAQNAELEGEVLGLKAYINCLCQK